MAQNLQSCSSFPKDQNLSNLVVDQIGVFRCKAVASRLRVINAFQFDGGEPGQVLINTGSGKVIWGDLPGNSDCIVDGDGSTSVCVDTNPPTSSETITFTTGGIERGRFTSTGVFEVNQNISLEAAGLAPGDTGELRFKELASNGTNYIGFKGPDSIPVTHTYTLPILSGAASTFLQTNGSNQLTWAPAPLPPSSFADDVFNVYNAVDNTKRIFLYAGDISTATDRTFSAPNSDGVLPLADANNNVAVGETIYSFFGGVSNTFMGNGSGIATTAGSQNTAVGNLSLTTNTTGSQNTAVGVASLTANTTGAGNTAVGVISLTSNTTGGSNTAVGLASLDRNTTGSGNTGIGVQSLRQNTTGGGNTATGVSSLDFNTTGANNTAVGNAALRGNTTASQNTAIGASSLAVNTTGTGNTAAGFQSLRVNTTGGSNVAVGLNSLATNTTGGSNTAVGHSTLLANTAAGNTAVGQASLTANTSAPNNTAVGLSSLAANTTGTGNTAVGSLTLSANTTTSNNTAVGNLSLRFNTGTGNTAVGQASLTANLGGNSNTAVGLSSLAANTTSSNNTALGSLALALNTTGGSNTAVGQASLTSNTTASNNTAVGVSSLALNTTGTNNVAVGNTTLFSNTTGTNNTAVGISSLAANTVGAQSVAVGQAALGSNTIGTDNTAVGHNSALVISTGNSNTCIGKSAGLNITTGSSNICIGVSNGPPPASATLGDQIIIGSNFVPAATVASSTFIKNIVGTVVAGAVPVLISPAGQLGTILSSIRYKRDVQTMSETSIDGKIFDLRPVTFKWKPECNSSEVVQYGLIAEEVHDVLPELVVYKDYEIDGEIKSLPETIAYQNLIPLMLNEIQKLKAEVASLSSLLIS